MTVSLANVFVCRYCIVAIYDDVKKYTKGVILNIGIFAVSITK